MSAPADDADEYAIMRAIGAVVAKANAGTDPGDVGWVIDFLESSDEWVSATAAEAIGPLGLRDAMPRLVGLLASGPEPSPETVASDGHAYALAVESLEAVDVRLAAAHSLGRLLQPGDDEARAVLETAAENAAEHGSVRATARAALFGDGSRNELARARARAVELALRMDAHAGLITEAREYGHRMKKADREFALVALQERNRDGTELAALVRWALDRHREEMLEWADAAAALELTEAYRKGWEQTRARWAAGPEAPADRSANPPPALSWLITMWHRANADE